MRWFYTLVAVGLLVGCSGAPDDPREDSGTSQDAGPDVSPREITEDPAVENTRNVRQGPCGRTETTKFTVDGRTYVFVVPLPCNPFYRDMGDPQPSY